MLNDMIKFLQAMIEIPTLSGEEQPVADIIEREMHKLGFDRVWVDVNGSVIGIVEGAKAGQTILLDAHYDTVGIAPGSVWERDPFSAEIVDGYVHGRGSADMKGALAAMIYAAAGIDRSQLAGRVAVSATVLEEVMEGISLAPIIAAVEPDFVIIGEASELNLNRGGRGRAEIHIETIGKPAHSSNPHLGLNAVHEMIKVIKAIETIDLPQHPLLGDAIMALTDMISDPYPGHSVVPSRCRVTYDRRLLTGETQASVLAQIKVLPALAEVNFTAKIAQGEHTAYTGSILRGPKFFPAWEFAADHPFVESALRGLQHAGLSPKVTAYRFCTNGATSAGVLGVPTIGFGPAAEGDAHVVDEKVEIAALEKAVAGYQGIILAALAG